MGVGFIHGVMNTDNMTISGETIDYGPCAFMEHFDPNAVFSSIDTSGRYAYGNQPAIAQWNLARLADALLPLIDADAESAAQRAGAAVEAFAERFDFHWTSVLRLKLGLDGSSGDDRALADDYLKLMSQYRIDFTLAFARLADAAQGNDTPLRALFGGTGAALELSAEALARAHPGGRHEPGRTGGGPAERRNPIYIPRNHHVEAALAAAVERDNLAPFERLLRVLEHPFDEHPADISLAEPAPAELTENYRTFCGT